MAADPRPDGTAGMDYAEHTRTYDLFTRLTAVVTPTFLTWLLAVGIGGMKHRPVLALLLVFASLVAAAVGLASRAIGWTAALIVLALSFFTLVLV